jgi:hypothetical protein
LFYSEEKLDIYNTEYEPYKIETIEINLYWKGECIEQGTTTVRYVVNYASKIEKCSILRSGLVVQRAFVGS